MENRISTEVRKVTDVPVPPPLQGVHGALTLHSCLFFTLVYVFFLFCFSLSCTRRPVTKGTAPHHRHHHHHVVDHGSANFECFHCLFVSLDTGSHISPSVSGPGTYPTTCWNVTVLFHESADLCSLRSLASALDLTAGLARAEVPSATRLASMLKDAAPFTTWTPRRLLPHACSL